MDNGGLDSTQTKQEVLQHFQLIYKDLKYFLESKLSDRQDAEDIMHDLYINLSNLDEAIVAEIREPKHYLFRMANNLALNCIKRKKMVQTYDSAIYKLDPPSESVAAPPDAILESRRKEAALHQAIACMPSQRRQVFLLLRFRGLTRQQIAEELDLSLDAVNKHIVRAMLFCREWLQKEGAL